jgi:hypothetical protein
MRHAAILILLPVLCGTTLCACQSPPLPAPEPSQTTPPIVPSAATEPSFGDSRAGAAPRAANTNGLSDAQIDTMFDAAVDQAATGNKAAICVAMQGLEDRAALDAPAPTIVRLSAVLRLPAVPASQCGFDEAPFVIATGAKAMLYTVRIEARDPRGVLTFWAVATYGNLGANGTQYRLIRKGDRWVPVRTGLTVVS